MANLGAMKCLQSLDVPGPSPEELAAQAFDSAANLCKSEKRDSVILGLQSLCNLTDPLKANMKTADLVSQWILLGHQTHSTREDIAAILAQVVEDDEDVELASVFEQQKHYSLIALANALDMCAKNGSLGKAAEELSWFETVLIPTLLDALKGAAGSASNAYAAARGIGSILSSSEASLRMIEENNGMDALKMAHKVGLECHDLLASETARCLGTSKP